MAPGPPLALIHPPYPFWEASPHMQNGDMAWSTGDSGQISFLVLSENCVSIQPPIYVFMNFYPSLFQKDLRELKWNITRQHKLKQEGKVEEQKWRTKKGSRHEAEIKHFKLHFVKVHLTVPMWFMCFLHGYIDGNLDLWTWGEGRRGWAVWKE